MHQPPLSTFVWCSLKFCLDKRFYTCKCSQPTETCERNTQRSEKQNQCKTRLETRNKRLSTNNRIVIPDGSKGKDTNYDNNNDTGRTSQMLDIRCHRLTRRKTVFERAKIHTIDQKYNILTINLFSILAIKISNVYWSLNHYTFLKDFFSVYFALSLDCAI